ncbi:cache domain-containing sensor histidine kinase [Paenibacillus sp. FA6]|uniref:cache domain-containing sensor histidine kinase n=1 Tax=Paenibacillus sp. FA6 TaxID=3413029 RepID=UPI003F6571BA
MIANKSLRFKLLLNFVVIIVLSILTLSIVGSTMYKKSIEEETNMYTIQMMNQAKNNIQVSLKEMDNIMYYLSQEQSLIDFLLDDSGHSTVLTSKVKQAIALFETKHTEISGILAVSNYNEFVSNKIRPITRDPLSMEKWFTQATQQSDTIHLISHPIGRNIKVDQNLSADQVLSFVKAVKDPINGSVLGVVLIDMKLDYIQKIIESVSLGKSGFIYIADQLGEVVYSPVNPIVYRIKGEKLDADSGNLVRSIEGHKYQMMYNTFQDINWRIVGVFPLDESLKVVTDLQFYTILIALITLLFAFIASWYFTNSIVRPVGKLQSLMKKVEVGELDLRFHSETTDEIGQLGNSFNNMMEEIENLINQVYMEQREKREAELKILQAQIKPHFLYNTLDTIQWMAQDRDATDIVEIVGALTTLFRISLNKGKEIIKLEEEVEHIESYLFIQMARYEDKLSYEINVPKELLQSNVLKIILQPLIENAIYHGIKTKLGTGHICVGASQEDHKLVLYVEDDGMGIPPKRLAEINHYLHMEQHDGQERGYGLFNVNERIKLSHGSSYGLKVTSVQGEGTRIEIRLPFINS